MSELFHKTFVDGLTGTNGFGSVSATNGTITHSAGAGLNGTSGGVTFAISPNSPNLYGTIVTDFSSKNILRTAWYLDWSSLVISSAGQTVAPFRFSGPAGTQFSLLVINVSGTLNLRHYVVNDSGVASFNQLTLQAMDWLEMRGERASGAMTPDGSTHLYAGGGAYAATGELISEHTGVQNYTRFSCTAFLSGLLSSGAGTGVTGSVLFDEFIARDDDTPILFGVSESVISRGMKYVLNRRRRKSYCW